MDRWTVGVCGVSLELLDHLRALVAASVVVQIGQYGLAIHDGHLDHRARGWHQIGFDEKVDKQQEEQEVQTEAREGDGQRQIGGYATQLAAQAVRVDVQADEHLGYLHGGQHYVHLAWNPHFHRRQCVVRVHERVNENVHIDHPAGSGGHIGKGEPRVDQCERVMDPVQVDQPSLAQHYEQRVHQLGRFGQREEQVPSVQSSILWGEQSTNHYNQLHSIN